MLFKVAGIMEQDREQAELKQVLSEGGLGSCQMAGAQQPCHAKGALKSVLEVVIPGVHRLVIAVAPLETLYGPAKGLGYESAVAARKHREACGLHRGLDSRRIFADDRWKHQFETTRTGSPMHAFYHR